MKKFASMIILLVLVSVAFGANDDVSAPSAIPSHVFKASQRAGGMPYNGPCATPTLVDTIDLSPINSTGYCWGLAYDWERDALWVTQWNSAYPRMYAIQKHSPCTKVDSVTLGSGAPTYRLGIGYAGSNVMYMAGYNNTVYRIDMTNGTGSVYRTLSGVSGLEGFDFNVVDDVLYASDWSTMLAGYAKPSQTGTYTTWTVPQYPCGMSGAYSGTSAPTLLFQAEEASPSHFYQYRLTAGVPNTTPESVWTCDPGQTQGYEADCAFDGQYVYILDQSGPDKIWVYDIGIVLDDTVRWTFETGWQGWTHTSSYTFPNAWGVAPSNLHSGWVPPNAQDSCLWFDDDAAGSGAPPLQDTALSPVIVPHSTTNWLKWGVTYNYLGTPEYLEVGIKYFDGSTWFVVPLRTYTADIAGAWDSADVSAYKTYPRLQVYAYYDDGNDWMWYGAIDNVTINGELYVATHDVGTTAINQPPDNLLPNTSYTPTATYNNFGNNNETFNVYFQIDSSGTTVYNQSQSLVLNAGEDTTLTFPNWTCCGTTGITYNLKAYTVLAGDVNPANDTVAKNAVVNPTFWEILSATFPSPSSGHSEATIDDGKYMVFGIRTTGGYTNQTQIYDINAGAWTAGPTNPYGCGAYGSAQGVNGKYYRIGGTDSWPTALTRVDIYDPGSTSWSSGANAPTGLVDHVTGVYKDSLIFSLGGGNWGGSVAPNTNVYFYDTYLDTWTQATSMTGVGRGCAAGGVIDTFAIVACGYDGSSTYRNDYIVGIINQSNCSQIAWGSPVTIPGMTEGRYRVPGGVDKVNKELWVVCGQTASGTSDQTWSYNPYTNTWTNWNAPKPQPVGNVSPVAVTLTAAGDIGVFVASGYFGGSYVNNHEVFHTGHVPGVQEKPVTSPTDLKFGFASNMPNPTRDYSAISYTTTKSGKVTLKVYDATGRLVRTLVNRPNEPAGSKTVYWDARDDNKQTVTGGVYFVKLEAEGKVASHKLILVK